MLPTQRRLELDFLRGVAILLVTLGHHAIAMDAGWLGPVVQAWHSLGWTGVDLFFVLSGFLISGLLFEEYKQRGLIDVRRFIVRRGFKIWPLYFLYLLLATIVRAERSGSWSDTLAQLWPNYLHVQNYFPTPLQHTWSLAVEEHFYLGLPLLLILLIRSGGARQKLDALPWVLIGLLGTCLMLRYTNLRTDSEHTYHWPTHLRIDSLCVGVFVGYFFHFRPESLGGIQRHPVTLLLTAGVLLMPLLWWTHHDRPVYTLGYTVIALAYALGLIGSLAACEHSVPLRWFFASGVARLIAFVGFYSYPIYLFHFQLGQMPARWVLTHSVLGSLPTLQWVVVTGINLATVIGIGVLFGKLTERPILAMRDRLFPSGFRAA